MVPKIRFKEFTANWKDQVLKDVCSVIMDGTHFSPKSKDGPKKYITSKNIRNEGMLLDDVAYISEEEHRAIYKKCPVQHGDVLLTKDGANTGNCCLNSLKEEFSLLSSVAVIRGKENSLKSSYLLQVLQSKKGQSKINDHIAGQAITRITLKKINEFSFSIPALDEQTKISDFLSSVDEKTALLNKQYDLLCQYKKGMMQKIFCQEVRFKNENGEEFPEWNSCQLKDVATRVTRKNKENNQTILTISGRDGLVDQMSYFNKQIASKNVAGYYLINNGEFAYNKSYSQGYPMGAIKMLTNYDRGVVSTLYICFKLNTNQSNSFYQHYFESGLQNRSIEKVAQEGARNHGLLNIGVNDFFNIELKIPSLKEQIKISDYLSALDDKITVKKAELDKLKTWKQGLLQQMFV